MNWLTSRCAPLAAFAALALAGCDKGTDLNVDLPDTTSVSTEYQDFAVDVATVRLAPVQTQKTDHYLVGSLNDNVAGSTTAAAYLNVISGGVVDSLPGKLPSPRLDSVVMVMGFDKVYGSATTPAKFDVYQLAAPLDERQVYDANSPEPALVSTPLGTNLTSRLDRTQTQIVTAAVAATTTSPAVPAVTATIPDPSVRLLLQRRQFPATPTRPLIPQLDLPFATNLFAQLASTTTVFGQTQLDAALKGIAIKPTGTHNSSILSFGRTYSSRMVFYFHSADTLRRSYSVYFGPVYSSGGYSATTDPRYFTKITNVPSPILAPLANLTSAVPSSALGGTSFLQEGVGLGTRVTFNGLQTLINTPGLIVNRAEIRVPVKPYTNALFPNPGQLYAVEVDANNTILQRIVNFTSYDRVVQADGFDQQGINTPALSALVDGTAVQPYYSLPITSYLQAYLTNKLGGNPASLVLVPNIRNSATLTLNRAVVDADHVTLRVYYSKR